MKETRYYVTTKKSNKLFDDCMEWGQFCRMGRMKDGSIVRDWVYGAGPDFNICAYEYYKEEDNV